MSGPIPTSACSVCSHALRGYIDSLVTAGNRSMKSVAAETRVSYDALRRHSARHVAPQASVVAVPSAPLPAGSTPAEVMRRRVDDLIAMDTSAMSSRDRIAHSEELRRAAESLARMAPPPPPDGVSFHEVNGLAEFFADLMTLVDRFPMIRPAMIDMTRRHFPMEGT